MKKKNNRYSSRKASNKRRKRAGNCRNAINGILLGIIALAGLILSLYADADEVPQATRQADQCLLRASLPDNLSQIEKQYQGFFVSFNPDRHIPNYVSWFLTPEMTRGTEKRKNIFRPDPEIDGCPSLADYRNSGFDRGHMAPAADMKWSAQAMADCHFLTNMCPQDHALNGGRWNTLENLCRTWAVRDSGLLIIAGPVMSDVLPRSIGQSRVAVPERFFKIIYAPYAEPPRAIGFIFPNSPVSDRLEDLAVTVDQIEEISGIDFLECLPDDLESTIESRASYRDWTRRKR